MMKELSSHSLLEMSRKIDSTECSTYVTHMYCRTEADFRKYVSEIFAPKAPIEELEELWTLYPSTPSEGSPFGTGNLTIVSPQFKRMAAFQGDVVFQAPTRFFLQTLSGRQNAWSFCEFSE